MKPLTRDGFPLRRVLVWGAGAILLALALPRVVAVFVDERGHTYLTDSEEPPARGASRVTSKELREQWRGALVEPSREWSVDPGGEEGRFWRELNAARADLASGAERLGLARLRQLCRDWPGRPEPWLLIAEAELRRGHPDLAREAIDEILRTAAPVVDSWRESALRLAQEIEAEAALSASRPDERSPVRTRTSSHFRVTYDHRFARHDYGARVLELLERARSETRARLGRSLSRPLEVRLYSRAHYLERYGHRFGFATVGFYDGAIHVVSARHPREELLGLLVHEYVHALFSDALASHRPFFLNEGIAEAEEERARGRVPLSRRDWRRLLEALRAGEWIPLASLVQGFGGLTNERSTIAYLESRAAVDLIEAQAPGAIARWLAHCADGMPWEKALESVTGWDLAQLEQELILEVRSRFPEDPLAASR